MLVIKLSGLALIFLSSSLFGFYKARLLGARVKTIGGIIGSLSCLKEQIEYGGGELGSILPLCFSDTDAVCIDTDGIKVSSSILTAEDKGILDDLFAVLGSADSATECSRIERCLSLLKRQYHTAQDELNQKGKLWRSGGVCLGAAICIFLI